MYPCELKTQDDQPTLTIRFRSAVQDLPKHFSEVYAKIGTFLDQLDEQSQTVGVFAAYRNMDMQNLEVEAGYAVAQPLAGKGEIVAGKIPAGTFAICHYVGPYEQTGPAYEHLMQFLEDRGYRSGSIYYEWYLNGPEVPPSELKTDLVIPVFRQDEKLSVR